MAANDGDHPVPEIFPGIQVPSGTGAAGTQGVSASETNGPVVGDPRVVMPYQSSQEPLPQVQVTAGDTSSFSDDQPVHTSPLMPGTAADYESTGAGQGSAGHFPHPSNMNGAA